jgi:CRISPR-associated protein (TIGR02710 family)
MIQGRILLAIVGTGKTIAQSNNNYISVLEKIIQSSQAETIVLFASSESCETAVDVQELYKDKKEIYIRLFKDKKTEFDADKCFQFFSEEINQLLKQGATSDQIVIDFTHGTKPMSAALYAIGMLYQIPLFQYAVRVSDENGKLSASDCEIKEFDATYARWLAKIKEAKILFNHWQFDAAYTLLNTGKVPSNLKALVERIKSLAKFYSAWDRFDYNAAIYDFPESPFPEFGYIPPIEFKTVLQNLNISGITNQTPDSDKLIDLIFDIYANGLRRYQCGQYEDALVRCYRLAELFGQYFLKELGYSAANMPSDDPYVQRFKQENNILSNIFGRKQVIKFLKYRSIDQWKIDILEKSEEKIEKRNHSILAHGFQSQANDFQELEDFFVYIEQKLQEIVPHNFKEKLAFFTFMNHFTKGKNNDKFN